MDLRFSEGELSSKSFAAQFCFDVIRDPKSSEIWSYRESIKLSLPDVFRAMEI